MVRRVSGAFEEEGFGWYVVKVSFCIGLQDERSSVSQKVADKKIKLGVRAMPR